MPEILHIAIRSILFLAFALPSLIVIIPCHVATAQERIMRETPPTFALRARLDKEVSSDIEREDKALPQENRPPYFGQEEYSVRYFSLLMSKLEAMEETPVTFIVKQDVSNGLSWWQMLLDEKQAELAQVESESIKECVQALMQAPFSGYFNPKLADPLRFGIVSGSFASTEEVKKDPRVHKLLAIAQTGTVDEKAVLLTAIKEAFENREQFGPLTLCSERRSFFEGPGMGIPIILAALDESGEMLPLLVDIGVAYTKFLFGSSYEPNDNAMVNGKGPITMFSGISALAIEDILQKLTGSLHMARAPLIEYLDTRIALQERFKECPRYPFVESEMLARVGATRITEMGLLELTQYMFEFGVTSDEWLEIFPPWFQPGNIEWVILAMGNRVNKAVELGGMRRSD